MQTFVVTMNDGEEKRIQADEVITPIHNAAVLTFMTDNRPVAIVNTANVRMVVSEPVHWCQPRLSPRLANKNE